MSNNGKSERTIAFHVRKYDPTKDREPTYVKYPVPVLPGMTVLEGLHYIKEHHDRTLGWRYSCRMGVCGSCGMIVNGKPTLACNTQILDVADTDCVVGPLANFDIIRDLAPDLSRLFEKHRAVKPHILRDEKELNDPQGEYYQTPEQLEHFLQFTYCIKCGVCMSACPTLATDIRYLGPQPLTQAFRYNSDTRDAGRKERAPTVGGPDGVARCHYAGECSRACPKGVDPARAIQLLKRQLVGSYLRLLKEPKPCDKQGPCTTAKRRPEIPEAPARTVEQTTTPKAAG